MINKKIELYLKQYFICNKMLVFFIILIYFLMLCFNIPYTLLILIINFLIMLLVISYKYINDVETNNKVGYIKFKVDN